MDTFKIILLAVICFVQVRGECGEPGYVKCRTNDRCVRIRYICDGDNDCGDMSDEEDELCAFQRSIQGHCDRRDFSCGSGGYCEGFENFCSCEERKREHPKWCQMIEHDGSIQHFSDVVVRESSPESTGLEEALQSGEAFRDRISETLEHDSCPTLFTKVGDHCLSFLYFTKMNWGESRAFCQALGGDLLALHNDVNEYFTLVRHIQELNLTADFWLGGYLKNETTGFEWIDGTLITEGTPFWAVRHEYACSPDTRRKYENCNAQAPNHPAQGHCLALTHGNYYYFSDEPCMNIGSPICVIHEQ